VRLARCLALMSLASLLVGCSASPAAPAGTAPGATTSAVAITSAFAFEPAQVTVSRGATVTWTNTSGTTHTITSGSPDKPTNKFNRAVEAGKTFAVTFADSGTFDYFCSIHQQMRGTVVVK